MSETLKYIVAELNRPPFNKEYSLISFDSLEGLSLLQVLTDVLADIEPNQNVDVREERPEETVMRIFEMLRIFKYNLIDEDQVTFRQGVVEGKKRTIHPILSWVLKKKSELKERAYLARYLVKVEIPAEFLADSVVGDLYEQYSTLMEIFKETHKHFTSLRSSGFNTTDVKKDIESMESEKDQLLRKVEKLKKKVSGVPNGEPMLQAARNLRIENDDNIKLIRQQEEQRNMNAQMEQRILRLQQQLKDKRQAAIGMTPQSLIQRLEEEVTSNSYLVKSKLPQELNSLKSEVAEAMRVALEPAMGHDELDAIQQKIRSTNMEINKLIEKKMSNMSDHKIGGGELYRQQASIVRNKKEAVAEALNKTRNEVHRIEQECKLKKMQVNEINGGEEVMTTDELRKLAQQLRSKHMEYKEKKKELSELKVEADLLMRTEDLLNNQSQQLQEHLADYESSHGVLGYHETQDALENASSVKSNMDEEKAQKLQDISLMVQQLNNRIDRKKQILAPIIKELRPLRQEIQGLALEHKEKKSKYEAVQAGCESNWSNLEREVGSLQEDVNLDESKMHFLLITMKANKALLERAEVEFKVLPGSDRDEKKSLRLQREVLLFILKQRHSSMPEMKKCINIYLNLNIFKDQLEMISKKIQEQEHLGRQLKEKHLMLRDSQESNIKQAKMWKDMERLLHQKMKLAYSGNPMETSSRIERHLKGDAINRLIL